jgi:ABC-type lipoprotein release transport system permease subunit
MRSFLLIVGFIGIFVVVIIAFSMNDFFRSYYVGKLEEKYQSFDLMMNVSTSGDSRFFSISQMNLDTDLGKMVEDRAAFFEFDVLVETQLENRMYVHVFSSSVKDFSKISTFDDENFVLGENEMIITKSFADSNDITIGDEISLYAKSSIKEFIIRDIVIDGHIFRDQSIFIDKEESISFFLSSLSPTLEGLPSILLKNMYNFVYIDINEAYTYDQVVDKIQEMPQYQNLSFTKTIDEHRVMQFVSRNISILSMMLSVVFISILFVLQTTLLVYFNEKKGVFSQVHILGGKKTFSLNLVAIELFTFFVISFLLSILITNMVLDFGVNYLNVNLDYHVKFISLLYAGSVVLGLTILMVIYYFKKFYQVADINHLKDKGLEIKYNFKKNILIIVSLMLGYLFLYIPAIDHLLNDFVAAIKIAIAVIFMYGCSNLFLKFSLEILKKRKEKNLLYFHVSMSTAKKAFKHYKSVILIAFLTIMLLVFANGYMSVRPESYRHAYKVDFIVTHIVSDFDDIYDEINELDHVKDAEKIGLYTNVRVIEENETINQLISIDKNQISTYFNLNINQSALDNFGDDNQLKILLPYRYNKLFNFMIGDKVSIYVNPTYGNQEFYISGFFEKQLNDLAFTNMNEFFGEQSSYQAIVVNSTIEKNELKEELLDLFSDQMIYITDVDQSMSTFLYEMERVGTYITFVLSLVIACFIIAMINHSQLLFSQTKADYARLFIIGYSKKKMTLTLVKEGMIFLLIFLITSVFGFVIIAFNFSDFGLLFGEYEPIKFKSIPILYGSLIIIFVFCFQYIIYIRQVLKIKIADVMKSY